jgi:hypothetical protein
MEQPKISMRFYKDADMGSQTQGAYWLSLYKNGKNISNEPFVKQDLAQLKSIAQKKGDSGYIELHNWLKNNRPGFFEKSITDSDLNRIVVEILKFLKEIL